MANPFLTESHEEIETAIMLEKAFVTDIGKAVAYTDGKRVFVNTEDNLYTILPNYNLGMLKWLLWHERYHMELKHHDRFFRYMKELSSKETEEQFHLTKDEVNIIMDILVHDSLSKMFPELVETAKSNLAQMRNSNSLKYTFTTFTLEEMLEEYRKYKEECNTESKGDGDGEDTEEKEEDGDETKDSKDSKEDSKDKGTKKESKETKHGESSSHTHDKDKKETGKDDTEPEILPDGKDKAPEKEELKPEHDDRDWSKLEDIDSKEFISEDEGDDYVEQINALKRKKVRIGNLTQKLNGLATAIKKRTYAMPSTIRVGKNIILKGRAPAKTELYLVFDASGSMGEQLETFKEIISKSIPQAMNCKCDWFSGWDAHGRAKPKRYRKVFRGREYSDYYKGTFKDIMEVEADNGYGDDGDRTIELCYLAEQAGYTPIGVTDGGGGVYHEETVNMLKQLKKTIFVGQNARWLEAVRKINPGIQTLSI